MPPVREIPVEIDMIVIGCSLCGYSVKGRVSEIELLVSVMPAHLGELILAQRMSVNGSPFRWYGDPDLVEQVTHAAR